MSRWTEEVACGYAWMVLLPSSSKVWYALVLITFLDPIVGALGLLGALSAWSAGRFANAEGVERPLVVLNGALMGLYVAHAWILTIPLLAITVLGGMVVGWVTVVGGRRIWSSLRLPIVSLPFALIAFLITSAGNGVLVPRPPHNALWGGTHSLLNVFGNLVYLPESLVGLLVIGVIGACSRYYLLLAFVGYTATVLWLTLLGVAPLASIDKDWASNSILATWLVGGLFATPSWITFGLATLAAVLTGWLSIALAHILDSVHGLPLSGSFVLAGWLVLSVALTNPKAAIRLNHLIPGVPEHTYARAAIHQSRMGDPNSTPLALPVMGTWTVSQGFKGPHTHRGVWRYALDFIVTENGKSFAGRGDRLEDFYCYDLPVISPAYGQIERVVNDLPDNPLGGVNLTSCWGNCVEIRLYNGSRVVLAHLQAGSVSVLPGAWVTPGDVVGRCGNSGRSPQPHLHLHLQSFDYSTTLPFHLVSVVVAEQQDTPRYELAVVPAASSRVINAGFGDVRAFYWLAGRGLRYTVSPQNMGAQPWTLCCAIDDRGRLTLVSNAGGGCVVESTWAIFSCYERHGNSDPYLDIWILACGYTPVSVHVDRWQDRYVLAQWLPDPTARWWATMLWPWAVFAESTYQRTWDDAAQAWRQKGHHRQKVTGITVTTEALLVPQVGCTYVSAQVGDVHYQLHITGSFQQADIGMPAWETTLPFSS